MIKNKLLILASCLIFLSDYSSCFSKEWSRAYLATYPRSGNHWIRYLVEEAAHIATGSVYRDREPMHMDKVFPWGGYSCDHGYEGNCRYPNKDDIVLVKTHFPAQSDEKSPFDELSYQVTIRIMRHPIDSFYSRYVKNPRGLLEDKVPSKRVKEMIRSWHKFQTYWNKKENVLTVRYEDILANPTAELRKILEALNYNVTDEDIARAIAKYPPDGWMLKHINRFTYEDLKLISDELSDLMAQFDYKIPL
jgi:hypothetical protein